MNQAAYEKEKNNAAAAAAANERELAALRERINSQPKKPLFYSMADASNKLLPEYMSQSGEMLLPYAEQLAQDELTSLPKLQEYAYSTNRSPWAQLMFQRQALDEQSAREKAQNEGAQASASAWNQMAMRGGVSGGERERIGTSGALNTANNLATIGREGQAARIGIDTQEAQDRLNTLKTLPQFELQKAELLGKAKERDVNQVNATNEANINKLIQNTQGRQAYDLGTYSEQMKAWAAEKTAQAQENSGK